ncbi:MAG TPA: hypothetical protein VM935_01825, partial [Chitinophagaceae bacterium]|nr:hypothetical protein [Chitinophagaceae bacterium]
MEHVTSLTNIFFFRINIDGGFLLTTTKATNKVVMSLTSQIAKHFREVYFGGNWTAVNMKDTLAHINWQQATTKVDDLNTIAALVFHINYYVCAVLSVLEGKGLNASDKFSFDLSLIHSEDDWQALLSKT